MEKYCIFSIDDQSPLGRNQFIGWFKGMAQAGLLTGELIPLIGYYKGQTEYSYICHTKNMYEIVAAGFIDGQESVMLVSECNKQYARLAYSDGRTEGIGSLKSVNAEEALKHEAWTYRPDMDVYWIAVDGNPDTLPVTTSQVDLTYAQELDFHLQMILDHGVADLNLAFELQRRLHDFFPELGEN